MTYEELQIKYMDEVTSEELDFSELERLKGLYCDSCIAIDKNLETNIEKGCIYAEELGHHFTTSGDIIDQDTVQACKQEYKARFWAYNEMVGLIGIIRAYEYGCRNRFEMAEYLDVTEEFLNEVIVAYERKFGLYVKLDNYVIYFYNGGISVFQRIGIPKDIYD